MKIMIVDDDAVSRSVFKAILSKYGQCDIISNGTDAIQAYKTSLSKADHYNLIIIDIMMPTINGYEVLKAIREIEKTNNIDPLNYTKIIIATGLDDTENRQIAEKLDENAETYLIKSANIDKDLITKLWEFGFYEMYS